MPVLTQMGYVCGLILIVPLSDVFEPKNLMGWMALQTTVMLAAVAVAGSATRLLIASFALGASTVVPQLAVPTAARAAQKTPTVGAEWEQRWWSADRGGAVPCLRRPLGLSDQLALGLRCGGNIDGDHFDLPVAPAPARGSLRAREVPDSSWLAPDGRPLGTRRCHGEPPPSGLMFGALSCFWVTVSFFVEGDPYHAGPAMVGFLALVGAVERWRRSEWVGWA